MQRAGDLIERARRVLGRNHAALFEILLPTTRFREFGIVLFALGALLLIAEFIESPTQDAGDLL